jgi:hypothetical protein
VLTASVHRLRASGCIPGALDLFGVLTDAEFIGTIFVGATSLPIDLNRQNATESGCHQHTAFWDRTAPASRRRSACYSGSCALMPGNSGSWTAIPGATRSGFTGGSPTSPATSPCGRTSRVAKSSICSDGSGSGIDPRRRADLIARFELDPTKKGGAYSKGNRVKVALVAALASDVELLLLDEPTSGLDPLMEGVFRACIAEERRKGRTVLLSSHLLDEVEALCDRVTIIPAGKAVQSGSLAELRHLSRTAISVELAAPPVGLAELPGVDDVHVDGRRVRLKVDACELDAVMRALTTFGLRSLVSQPLTLEELFLRHYTAAR